MKLKNFITGLSLFLSTSGFVIASDDMQHSNTQCPDLSNDQAQEIIDNGSIFIQNQEWLATNASIFMFETQHQPHQTSNSRTYEINHVANGVRKGELCNYEVTLQTSLLKQSIKKNPSHKTATLSIKKAPMKK